MASTSKVALRPPPIHRSSPFRPPRQLPPRFRPHPRRVHLQSASCRARHRLWGRDSPEDSPGGEDPSFDRAVSLFNGGDYYQCHDSLEELWYGAEEPVRTLLHGLLQCAVGLHHLFNQNHRGAMMELGEGLCKLRKLDFVSGPFFQFEQEVSAALEFLYQTQKELAAWMNLIAYQPLTLKTACITNFSSEDIAIACITPIPTDHTKLLCFSIVNIEMERY